MIKGACGERLTPRQKAIEIVRDSVDHSFYWTEDLHDDDLPTKLEQDQIHYWIEIAVGAVQKMLDDEAQRTKRAHNRKRKVSK